jgi:hypothetical protein
MQAKSIRRWSRCDVQRLRLGTVDHQDGMIGRFLRRACQKRVNTLCRHLGMSKRVELMITEGSRS